MQPADARQTPGPLSGLLVVDLTHVLNGPFGTVLLADLGARVIKVEPPGHGDDTRTYGPFVKDQSLYFSFINRGKESIVLDLKKDSDREVFLNMVRRADVVTENYRAGTMDRLGFSYAALAKENPRLIYASSSGFGHSGPVETFAAYDTVVQAVSGLMSITGFPDGPPTRVGTSVSDLIAGTFMFCGIVSALYAREKTGNGAQVDIAMSDCSFAYLEQALMEYVATGEVPPRIGNRHPIMTPFDSFEAQDGQFVIAAGNDHLFQQLCHAIGRPELAADKRFVTNPDRLKNNVILKQELERTLTASPKGRWVKTLHAAGVPVAPIFNVKEAAEHPQIAARNMLIEAGGIRMPGNPIKISGYEDPRVRVGAPTLDEHGAALRREFAPQTANAV